jgi:hypothetical protein
MRRVPTKTAAAVAFIALGIWLGFPTYKHRYRLTVEVEADGAIRSGSSVIETRWSLWPPVIAGLFNGGIGEVHVYGQAVFIDLGSRGALLALLWPSSVTPLCGAAGTGFLAIRAFNAETKLPCSGYTLTWGVLHSMSWQTGKATLTADNLPGFIWLPAVDDEMSARPVLAKDIPTVFGDAVRLRGAWVEITTDPIASGLERRLSWAKGLYEGQRRRGITSYPGQFYVDGRALLGAGFLRSER